MQRRVIVDAQKIWKHTLVHFLGECLSFGFSALAVSFQPVPQDLVEKHSGRSPREQRGAIEWFGQWRGAECLEVGRHFFFLGGQFLLGRESLGLRGIKSFHAYQVHSIVGACAGFHDQPRSDPRRFHFASFSRNEIRGCLLDLQGHR